MNKWYEKLIDLLEILIDSEYFDPIEVKYFNIDLGYYTCKKNYNLDIEQSDLDRLEQLKGIHNDNFNNTIN